MLGGIHDAYHATLLETGTTQTNGARTLMVLLGGKDPTALARQIKPTGIEIDTGRLRKVMVDGVQLASDVLLGAQPAQDQFHHSLNIGWLGDTFLRTDCTRLAPHAGVQHATDSGTGTGRHLATSGDRKPEGVPFLSTALGLLALVGLAFGIARLRKSLPYRLRKAERLPRTPVSIKLTVTLTNAEGNMEQAEVTGLDISAGGMKLEWEKPAPKGTTITLSLPIGERLAIIVWSNAYYAGTMFDQMLSNSELEQIT